MIYFWCFVIQTFNLCIKQCFCKQIGIIVKGIHDLAVRFSKCCSPVPGDEIVGFVTRGRGISIHRTDCINVINLPEDERARIVAHVAALDVRALARRVMDALFESLSMEFEI